MSKNMCDDVEYKLYMIWPHLSLAGKPRSQLHWQSMKNQSVCYQDRCLISSTHQRFASNPTCLHRSKYSDKAPCPFTHLPHISLCIVYPVSPSHRDHNRYPHAQGHTDHIQLSCRTCMVDRRHSRTISHLWLSDCNPFSRASPIPVFLRRHKNCPERKCACRANKRRLQMGGEKEGDV